MSQLGKEKVKEDLNSIFTSKQFISYCKNHSEKDRYWLIKRAIEFVLIVGDYQDFWNFNYNSAYDYLADRKNASYEEIAKIYAKKFVREGYLFHITPASNEIRILRNGLLTPASKEIDLEKSQNLEQYSRYLNNEYNNYFPIIIPNEEFNKSDESNRYNNIYFGFDLKYLLEKYGTSSELSRFIKMALEMKFNLDFQGKSREEILEIIRNKLIKDSILSMDEIIKIMRLLEPYIEADDYAKDIILFPYKKLLSNDNLLNAAKKNNRIDFLEKMVASSVINDDGQHREFSHCKDIPAEDLIIISTEQNPEVILAEDCQKRLLKF